MVDCESQSHYWLGVATVNLTGDGQADFDGLPVTIANRVLTVLERLEKWPAVSGAKPLRGVGYRGSVYD
jgi:hypothetical protein